MIHGPPRRKPLRLAFVGWARSRARVASLLQQRSGNITVVGVATRNAPPQESGLPDAARWLTASRDLRDVELDLVVEAAGRAAVEPWGLEDLRYAPGFVVSSTSAFGDDAVLQRLVDQAERCGSQILIPSGALAGLDALAAASRLTLESVTHRIVKPPPAWKGTLAEGVVDVRMSSFAARRGRRRAGYDARGPEHDRNSSSRDLRREQISALLMANASDQGGALTAMVDRRGDKGRSTGLIIFAKDLPKLVGVLLASMRARAFSPVVVTILKVWLTLLVVRVFRVAIYFFRGRLSYRVVAADLAKFMPQAVKYSARKVRYVIAVSPACGVPFLSSDPQRTDSGHGEKFYAEQISVARARR